VQLAFIEEGECDMGGEDVAECGRESANAFTLARFIEVDVRALKLRKERLNRDLWWRRESVLPVILSHKAMVM
jgi:hypothetical protein